MTVDYRTGQVLDQVGQLEDGTVDLVACSPPFWSLRDYNGLAGQWGSEPTPAEFLTNLLTLVECLGPKLAEHGSIAFELGDSYAGSGGAGGDYSPGGLHAGHRGFVGSAARTRNPVPRQAPQTAGAPLPKSMCLLPTLFAASLAYGHNMLDPEHTFDRWRVRNVIVWARSNPTVGALGDKVRPATSYITVVTRSPKRWFDLDAVRKPYSENSHPRVAKGQHGRTPNTMKTSSDGNRDTLDQLNNIGTGAPPTDYWTDEYDGDLAWLVNAKGSSLAHYAMWPAALAERLVLSMCPPQVCTECGEPSRRLVKSETDGTTHGGHRHRDRQGRGATGHRHEGSTVTTVGWSDCGHDNWRPGMVLDPFAGSGTTLCVADIHNRDAIGIDLDPATKELMPRRMAEVKQTLLGYKDQNIEGQIDLFGGVA